ncbi:MAG: molybdopterin biosynthesis protein [Deltaproteobacteria bacterium]|nr:molybdopterin biosynthesis protein [Deltaproteobacteria bacterium]
MKRNVYLNLLSVAEAQARLSAFPSPLAPERLPLAESVGRVLAEPAVAVLSSPAYHGAAMDGVAVRADLTFGASQRRPKTLAVGAEAFWVNTGSPMPQGTDAVIMVENIVPGPAGEPETVTIEAAAYPWQHVRKIGEDIVATESLLSRGTLIGAYELGAMAAAGILEPIVWSKPKVVFLPTGSEIAPLGTLARADLLSGRKLPEFNSLMIKALAEKAGAVCDIWPITPDEPETMARVMLKAAAGPYDLILINAGSSAGSKDFAPGLIGELGELLVHGLQVMPGKPTAIGRIGSKPVIGLPGYPVSAVVAFELAAQVLLRRWQNLGPPERTKVTVRLFQPLASRPGLEERVRVKLGRVGQNLVAVPLPRGAGTVTSLARADGIISIPAQAEGLSGEAAAELIKPLEAIDGALLIIGSHDPSLDIADSLVRQIKPDCSLTSAHVGSLAGLKALAQGLSHLAGSHLLGPDGVYNKEAIGGNLKGVPVYQVRLVEREQGLIIEKGNPQNISSLEDLARPDVTFINRQKGSGTRVLLDYELKKLGLDPDRIRGYEQEEYTHLGLAAAVKGARAAAGLGVKAAAVALGLDFIPVGVEEYDLIIRADCYGSPKVQALLSAVRSARFRTRVLELGGYGISRTGEVLGYYPG